MNSSIMEYTANWYERLQPLGRYDRAAINFGYGDFVEVYDNAAGTPRAELNAQNTPRVWAKYYQGGEMCGRAADPARGRPDADPPCPYSLEGANAAELTEVNRASGLVQRCVMTPDTDPEAGTVGTCSSFDADANDPAILPPTAAHAPVNYRYC